MNKLNLIATPGAILFILFCVYSNYQHITGQGSEIVPIWIMYLFVYSILSFILWVVTFFRD